MAEGGLLTLSVSARQDWPLSLAGAEQNLKESSVVSVLGVVESFDEIFWWGGLRVLESERRIE